MISELANGEDGDGQQNKATIAVAVVDWGLGMIGLHAEYQKSWRQGP
ncbi:MAG: hypothetical protein ACLTS6_12170 [Anaerobutyricum sp.]